MVEAAKLPAAEAHEASGSACAPNIEFQTADTARLERVFDEPAHPIWPGRVQLEHEMEIEPVVIYTETAVTPIDAAQFDINVAESDGSRMTQTQNQSRTTFDGALLDLDERDF